MPCEFRFNLPFNENRLKISIKNEPSIYPEIT